MKASFQAGKKREENRKKGKIKDKKRREEKRTKGTEAPNETAKGAEHGEMLKDFYKITNHDNK